MNVKFIFRTNAGASHYFESSFSLYHTICFNFNMSYEQKENLFDWIIAHHTYDEKFTVVTLSGMIVGDIYVGDFDK